MNDNIARMLQKYKTTTRYEAERALREILQEIALAGLWRGKFFEKAAFYGGTALRILYGLDRFSEDLDFTLLHDNEEFSWDLFERNVIDELLGHGFEVSFAEKKKVFETEIQSAFLKTNTLQGLLQIGVKGPLVFGLHPDASVRIKVEIDSHPILGFDHEMVYLREPMPIPIRALKEPSLFAGKTHAALYRAWKHRVKGRDWYDLVWFLRRNIPLNPQYLEMCMRQCGELKTSEILTVETVKELLKTRVQQIDLAAAKDDVRPFLRDPTILDLWSIEFFHHWIDQLKFSD